MKTLTMTKGLPASGKTKWAIGRLAYNPGTTKRVNKDDLRAMMDGGKWSQDNEKFLIGVRDYIVAAALNAGKHVIVDDTNLAPKHQFALEELAKKNCASFVIEDFTHIPLETCIERDRKRSNYVGEKVILGMWEKFLAPPVATVEHDPGLPYCVIVDIDGTVALMNGRGPFDWHSVHTDSAHAPVCHIVRGIRDKIIYVSGRDAVCRPLTERWLFENDLIGGSELYMRPEGDTRDDRIIKREIYEASIKGKYNVRYVLDDRDKVVRMWRELGLTCLQVAPGDF